MIKLVKYDNETTYMFPSGKIATPEVMRAEFPAVTVFPHVLQVSGNVCQAVMELEDMKHPMIWNYIDENMPEWARPTIQKLANRSLLKGGGNGLNLTEELMRLLVRVCEKKSVKSSFV